MTDEKPELTQVVNEQMPLGAALGIRTFGGPDEVEATLEWSPELCTADGVLHGGVLMALADSAGGVCAFFNLPPGARTATIYALGNPLIVWAYLPAIAFAGFAWYRSRFRSMALAVVLAGFLGQWLPWMLSPRISFFYHMLPCVPFGCLAIAYGLSRIREPRVVALGYLVLSWRRIPLQDKAKKTAKIT